jgi:hypothetical protein
MTIAIGVKVDEGIVLAADSASSFTSGPIPLLIYNSGIKVFRLHKDLPLGAVTWGLGAINHYTIKLLAKEFRENSSTMIDPDNYTVEHVTFLFQDYLWEKYEVAYPDDQGPLLGMMIAGYSANQPFGELWITGMQGLTRIGPVNMLAQSQFGVHFEGMPTSLYRLLLGFEPERLEEILQQCQLSREKIDEILQKCRITLRNEIVYPFMPIQEAIDLAIFLADTASKYTHFSLGPDSVGGPIDVATITRYEGFKWIRRKHYYRKELN